jgi:hypothetical protein
MIRNLVICSTILFLAGCDLSTINPGVISPATTEPVEIIHGFAQIDTVTVGSEGFRVGWYYDFTGYDSLRINFSAKRLALSPAFDHIFIKIGPAFGLSDSLFAPQKDFSLLVKQSDIAKPQFAALTFYVPDAGVRLLLSQLRVIGWTAQ